MASSETQAQPRIGSGAQTEIDAVGTGDQLVVTRRDGTVRFAGREISLTGFSGMFGYASEVAYVVTIEGEAATEGAVAPRGRMLLLTPFGEAPMVERYDAARLQTAWPEQLRNAAPETYASLGRIARGQGSGIWFGRLGRTSFNVAASGSAAGEHARRSVLGGDTIRTIRFSGESDPSDVERNVVSTLVAALARGDAEAVAELIDPTPYGNRDLRDGGGEARLLAARALIAERDWAPLLQGATASRDTAGNRWVLAGPSGRAVVTLRPMGGFPYVQSVATGDAS